MLYSILKEHKYIYTIKYNLTLTRHYPSYDSKDSFYTIKSINIMECAYRPKSYDCVRPITS